MVLGDNGMILSLQENDSGRELLAEQACESRAGLGAHVVTGAVHVAGMIEVPLAEIGDVL